MKKLFVLLFVALLLCGCSKKSQVTPIVDNISFVAKITYGDDEYLCDLTIKNNVLNLVVKEPEEIKDLSLMLDKNGAQANFRGISFTPDVNSYPQGAVVQILFDILDDVSKNKSAHLDDENCIITGNVNDYDYTFTFAPTGLPIRLTADDIGLVIEFNNVTII